jgi:hypothetical protein
LPPDPKKPRTAKGLLRQTQRAENLRNRDFPDATWHSPGKAVCKRCGLILHDCEPNSSRGEFNHRAAPHQTRALACVNHNKTLYTDDLDLVPFLRKGRRRYLKRMGIRP